SRRPEPTSSISHSPSIPGWWCWFARARPPAPSGRRCRCTPSCECSECARRRGDWTWRFSSIRTAGTAASSPVSRPSSSVIDLKLLRTSPQQVRAALARRGDPGLTRLLDEVEALDMKRRSLASRLDQLNAERNEAARVDAAHVKREGSLPAAVTAKRRELGTQVAELEDQLKSVEADLERKALFVPNLPLPELPAGDASHNAIVRTWGEPAPRGGKPHWEIGAALGILALARGATLAGSGVPVTNLHRDEILDGTRLPLGYTAYTPCFRREAGAAGRDTRGLLRVHQFDKVELVRFARPAESAAEHERMTTHAEAVLQRLELPYRIALLAAGALGLASAQAYDLGCSDRGAG